MYILGVGIRVDVGAAIGRLSQIGDWYRVWISGGHSQIVKSTATPIKKDFLG